MEGQPGRLLGACRLGKSLSLSVIVNSALNLNQNARKVAFQVIFMNSKFVIFVDWKGDGTGAVLAEKRQWIAIAEQVAKSNELRTAKHLTQGSLRRFCSLFKEHFHLGFVHFLFPLGNTNLIENCIDLFAIFFWHLHIFRQKKKERQQQK